MADPHITNFLLDDETKLMLRKLAVTHERSMSAHLRWLIKQNFSTTFPDGTPVQWELGADTDAG
jgi:plasmid stability protein